MDPIDLIDRAASGVAKLLLSRDGQVVGSGTGFLVSGGVVTNSHVLRHVPFQTLDIHFGILPSTAPVRLSDDTVRRAIRCESGVNEHDFAYLALDEPEFAGRYRFTLAPEPVPRVGEQVVFLGYPFEARHLTSHVGYISSVHLDAGVEVLQIDGSVNSGNSGGPLLRLADGGVTGVVTRAMTGLMQSQWQKLLSSFENNISVLSQQRARMSIGGVDPVEVLKIGQAQMHQIAINLQRTANVGIGFAFSSRHVRDAMIRLRP